MLIQLVRVVGVILWFKVSSNIDLWLKVFIYTFLFVYIEDFIRIFTQLDLVLLHGGSMNMSNICFCAISFWVMLRLHINRTKVENENNDRPTEWVRVSILFWVLLAFLTVKHGYIHFAMNGIYNKISTIYPRKREYRPIKIFHLNSANCFGLLFHNILVGFIWNCATKSAGCVFTMLSYYIYPFSIWRDSHRQDDFPCISFISLFYFSHLCVCYTERLRWLHHTICYLRAPVTI